MIRRWLWRYGPLLFLFSLLRLVLWGCYRQRFFGDLDFVATLFCFFHGVRFDLAATLMVTGPVLFCIALCPERWTLPFDVLLAVLGALLGLLQAGDIVYYGYVGRHMADEVFHLSNDLDYLYHEVCLAHPWSGFLALLGAALWVFFYFRWIRPWAAGPADAPHAPLGIRHWIASFFCLLFVVAGVRGSFGLKPVAVVNAFLSEKASAGHLALNGVFTAWHAAQASYDEGPHRKLEQKELKEAVAPLGFDPAALYPLLRTFNGNAGVKPPGGGHPNIVLVIFESFGAFYVDSFHQGPGGPFGSTPRFDALARDGVRFSRFYANGSRSIEAIQNILTSFPAMRSLPTLGLGYEQTSISSLARLLREAGYHTLFAQSAARGSFRLDAIAGALGFQDYMGIEDYPRREVHRGQRGPQFGWDDEMFQGVAEKMQKMEEPFFIVMFTGSSHTPFAEHPPGINLRPGHGSDNEAGFLDMVAYSDQALGAFIDGLKRDVPGRFSRSVFAFTADHMFPPYRTFNIDQQFRVPFVLYAPGMLHAGEIQRIGSHLDILPTILALSGYRGGAATAGRPLMGSAGMEGTPEGNDFAFIAGSYGTPAIVTRQGILQHSLQQRLDSFFFDAAQCDHACLDDMEKRLLAYHQLLYQCFRLNRIQPDASGR